MPQLTDVECHEIYQRIIDADASGARPGCPRCPARHECDNNDRLPDFEDALVFACWYPGAGGRYSRAAVVLRRPSLHEVSQDYVDKCFDVYVWPDDNGGTPNGGAARPSRLHHCQPSQYSHGGFGLLVLWIQRQAFGYNELELK